VEVAVFLPDTKLAAAISELRAERAKLAAG
jgi:hypothetical protein